MHTKIEAVVFSEYDCSIRDCTHEICPTEEAIICHECTKRAWEEYEGGAVTWMECLDDLALDEFD